MTQAELLQWILVLVGSLGLFLLSPRAKSLKEFFGATNSSGQPPGFFLLTGSLIISWIFAKSITNAANLGLGFGLMGGVAYATYYLSFLVAGITIFQLRIKGGFTSLHQYLIGQFGNGAMKLFSLLIAIRLFNEVWSNSMVIGSYFGPAGSKGYYLSILLFTVLTLAYSLKGGLRSSMITDMIQMALFAILLGVILWLILPANSYSITDYAKSRPQGWHGAYNLALVALLQIFSYPFHDPVMTDRGFLCPPKLTLKSFITASIVGALCIFLFSLVGVFARLEGMTGQAPVEAAKSLGLPAMLFMNFIMITSASSTLDSAFASFSKLVSIDLPFFGSQSVSLGRIAMVLLAILGTIPVFLNAHILSATTLSGTMVLGLAPVFILWRLKAPPVSFFLSVGAGLFVGMLLALDIWPTGLVFSYGKYAELLSANLLGTSIAFLLYLIPVWLKKKK